MLRNLNTNDRRALAAFIALAALTVAILVWSLR